MSNSGKTWNRWRADREWFAVTTAFVVSARLGTMVSGGVAAMRVRLLECAAVRALCSGTPVFAVSARLGTMVSGAVAAMRVRLLECAAMRVLCSGTPVFAVAVGAVTAMRVVECAAMRVLCSGTPVFAVELVPEASAILVRVAVGSALETLR